jgi:hypothetical protein
MSGTLAIWASRGLWALVGLGAWLSLGQALEARSAGVRLLVAIAAWAVFGLTVVALVVPSTVSLTLVRMVAPLTTVTAVVAMASGAGAARSAAFVTIAAVNTLVVASGDVGEAFAQASAYGDEHRFPLRPPAAYIVPVVISWCLWCASVVAAPLLLGARRWVPGGVALALAVFLTWLVVPRYHRLSRRWLVVVPAGLVIHDHLVLADTLLVQRAEMSRVQLALADTQAADLTGPAAGHALDIAMRESLKVAFAATRTQPERAIHALSFLVAPTRPGRALRQADARNLPVA